MKWFCAVLGTVRAKYRARHSSGLADPGFGQPKGRSGRIDEDGGVEGGLYDEEGLRTDKPPQACQM